MPLIGANIINYRGDGPWRGMTTQSRSAPYQHELLEGCYVSSDGNELRTLPGYKCVIDLASTVRQVGDTSIFGAGGGFDTSVNECRRGSAAFTGTVLERTKDQTGLIDTSYYQQIAAPHQDNNLYVWSRPKHLHFFAFIRGRVVIGAEDDYRREPILIQGSSSVIVRALSYTIVDATHIEVTLSSAIDNVASPGSHVNQPNRLEIGAYVTMDGWTGVDAAVLNNKCSQVTAVFPGGDFTKIRLLVSAVGGSTGPAFINRVTVPVDPTTQISDDQESLIIYTVIDKPNTTAATPIQQCYPAQVANRMRDFGDDAANRYEGRKFVTGRSRRRQKSLPYRMVPHVAGDRLIMVAPGYGCVFHAPLVVPIDYTGSPGTALVWNNNDIYDRPRCVGVPKAVVMEDTDKAEGTTQHIYDHLQNQVAVVIPAVSFVSPPGVEPDRTFGGTAAVTRAGTYGFKFAYRDDATGEIGLASEPIFVVTGNGAGPGFVREGIRFQLLFPGYLMHESLALSVLVYRTQQNGDSFFFDRAIPLQAWLDVDTNASGGGAGPAQWDVGAKYGLQPNSSGAGTFWFYTAELNMLWSDDDELRSRKQSVPTLEQMPMGAKAGRTVRGWSAYGGALGNAGPRGEFMLGTGNLQFDGSATDVRFPTPNEVYFRSSKLVTPDGQDTGFGVSAKLIPPAYEGQVVFSRRLFPWPSQFLRLDFMSNALNSWDFAASRRTDIDRVGDIRWRLVDGPLTDKSSLDDVDFTGASVALQLPRATLQISEQDNPGVTPANNTTKISNEREDDIEGVGEANGQFVVCTRNKTNLIAFAQSPVGITPETVADTIGCIAANTMATFDDGCAWLSEQGPVAIVGVGRPQWIGEALQKFFTGEGARYQRDSTGMARHAWTCHDAERGLVYFGLFADRTGAVTVNYRGTSYTWAAAHTAGNNEAMSRFPCDEILIWSYGVNSWSVWRPLAGMEVLWMAVGEDINGDTGVYFLAVDNRIYVLDDDYNHFNKEPVKRFVATTGTYAAQTSIALTGGTVDNTVAARGSGENYVQAGMPVLIVSATTSEAVAVTSIFAFDTTGTIKLADAVTVSQGDSVYIGVKSMTVKTNYQSPKGTETSSLAKIGLRYTLHSRFVDAPQLGYTPQLAFVQAQVTSSRRVDQIDGNASQSTQPLTGTDAGVPYNRLGITTTIAEAQERGISRGSQEGQAHRLELTIVGGAQVRLQDLYAQVR